MKQRRLGQVLVEFALAAAGIIAIAFMIARIGIWLNDSMVARNASYQAQRTQAGSSGNFVRVAAVPGIHLIGPTASSTGGMGSQPAGPSASPPPGCPALSSAAALRLQALNLMGLGSTLQNDINHLHADARNLIIQANQLAWDAIAVAQWRDQIALYDLALLAVGNRPEVQAIGGINRIQDRINEIDTRIGQIDDEVGDITDQIGDINSRICGCSGGCSNPTDINAYCSTFPPSINQRLRQIADRTTQILNVEIPACTTVACILPLVRELSNLSTEASDLETERDTVQVPQRDSLQNSIQPLLDERADLVTERGKLQTDLTDVNNARDAKKTLLNNIDAVVNSWRSLWASLYGGSLAPDLSDLYLARLAAVNHVWGSGEPSMMSDIASIINRLWQMARQRLDLADSAQSTIPPLPPAAHLPPIPDAIHGKYDQANDKVNQIKGLANQIRNLIKQAEDLEAQARRDCASGAD